MYNFKVTSDQGKDDTSSNRTSSSRPSGAPRSDKDFKKILGDKDKQDDENEDSKNAKFLTSIDGRSTFEEIAEANPKPKQTPSLFDLSKEKIKKNANDETAHVVNMASADELAMESPSSIFKNLALKEKAAKSKEMEETLGKMDDEEGKTPAPFSQEADLNRVNPLAFNTTAVNAIDDKRMDQTAAPQRMSSQQIIEALVKAITTAQTSDKTDTIVTLKHPPLFEGSTLVLTSYESAKGQFNIRFENLTQQAQTFMDMQQNKDSLLFALQEKGYSVHIVVATTLVESPQAVDTSQQTNREGESQEQEQGQQKNRQKKNEEQ